MTQIRNCVVLLIIYLQLITARKLPSYIEPCRKSDPNVNECVIKHGNKALSTLVQGDQTLKIQALNPLVIERVLIEPSSTFRFEVKNISIHGFDLMEIIDANAQFNESKLSMRLLTPKINIYGDYDINGQILFLPIVGQGTANITLVDTALDYSLEYSLKKKKEIEYAAIKEHTVNYESKRVHFDLQNLFEGNQLLADEMKKFLNENWKEVHKELSGGAKDTFLAVIGNIFNRIFKVPFNEIFLE